jgi:glycosyltransferase involved in cell wall biosynthesis
MRNREVRIAILSPQPRTSGVVTYSHHVKAGFIDLGHEAEVVTFTLSGKPSTSFTAGPKDAKGVVRSGWGWSPLGFDRCERWDRAAQVLEEYDVILVEEPRCAPLDKRVLRRLGDGDIKRGRGVLQNSFVKADDLPPYITALASLENVKIATTLHDPWYGFRHAPFLEYFMDYVAPDVIVTHREGALRSAQWAGADPAAELRIPHLPYRRAPRPPTDIVPNRERVIGMTGRYINNKGQPTLALAAALEATPADFEIEIAGASPLGAGPNHTFLTYEGLTKQYGFEGPRDGTDVTRGWPWRVEKHGRFIEYSGPYEDPVRHLRSVAIHVNATDPAFSGPGGLEYSTLEAMDAGCLIVIPGSASPPSGQPEAQTFEINKLANAELTPVGHERFETVQNLGVALADACDIFDQPGYAADLAEENYKVLNEYHAPARYAEKILEAL